MSQFLHDEDNDDDAKAIAIPLKTAELKMLGTAFSSFPKMFSNLSRTNSIFLSMFNLSSASALNLKQTKILLFGN